jgi:hypothetical protein
MMLGQIFERFVQRWSFTDVVPRLQRLSNRPP